MMRSVILFFLLASVISLPGNANRWPHPAHYKYQLGLTFGVGDVSAPLTDFPGSHWGIYTRIGSHVLSFRREWDGEFLKLWGEPVYYHRTGLYYGLRSVRKNIQWGPDVGFGFMEHNREVAGENRKQLESGYFGEIGLNGLLNARGSGIGAKVFLNFSSFGTMVGGTIYLQVGYAWNDKPEKSQAKMGASPSLPKF